MKSQKLRIAVSRWRQILIDCFFPFTCPLCAGLLDSPDKTGRWLCSTCRQSIAFIDDPACEICGQPLLSCDKICLICREHDKNYTAHRSLFFYRESVKELVYQYKKAACRELAAFFAARISCYVDQKEPTWRLPVVAAPGNPESRRLRGWDQVDEIGKKLDSNHGFRYLPVLRRRATASQKQLNREERQKNLTGAIFVKQKSAKIPPRILLIDDIHTTGATLNECAKVLRAAGAKQVFALTLARD